ncbi:MAG: ABC transporter ATP-binding protein [Firmicutes bacterium]|nr:ABC transporter ATP-binding protein [Bacillota bacterium]NBI64459.1 ABC transporter ATP-binding protein [Clostridiales bacterium]
MFKFVVGALENEEQHSWKKLVFVSIVSPLLSIFSFSGVIYMVNSVARSQKVPPKVIIGFMVFMAIAAVLIGFFSLYKCKLTNRFIYGGAQRLSMKLYELLLKENLEHHNQKSIMQAIVMVRSDTTRCIQIITNYIGIWVNIFTMAGYAAMLAYVSGWIGLVSCVIIFGLAAGLFVWARRKMNTYGEACRKYEIRSNAQISIAYGIFEELKISEKTDSVIKGYQEASEGYVRAQSQFAYQNNSIQTIMQVLVQTAMFLVFAILLMSGMGLFSIMAPMIAYTAALGNVILEAYNIINHMNELEFAKKSYEMVRDGLARYDEVKEEERKNAQMRKKNLTFEKGIFAKNLTFAYEGREALFQNASIEIPKGHSIAVIGASGVGKTTLLGLLLGLLKPQEGTIFYDDYDIVAGEDAEGRCKGSIGELISYIPQTVYMNGATVRKNVAFFEEDSEVNDEHVLECLDCAQIKEDVLKMPEGIHTLIGENGTSISGGQRQRIALARALYKDFELLVMDEATAALDMETEKAVIDSIRQVKGNKTMLMVTHHMSLANECDIVYRIENQKLVRQR